MPPDLLREASNRLAVMALLGAILWATGTVLIHLAAHTLGEGEQYFFSRWTDAIAGGSVILSLALFVFARKSRQEPAFILDLGLVYMVITSLALGLTFHWNHVPEGWPVFPMLSWIGAVVLIFAAIIPCTPAKTLLYGILAASMNPLGMFVARARGTWDFGPLSNIVVMHYPDYLLVGVAVVISHVHTRLGRQVAKAREMGSYHLGELLGRGGMGEVYRATHRMLARPAAIKLIRPEMIAAQGEAAQIAVQRFRREAEAAANLRSPHTVELYDFGVTSDGTLYFVMEFLEGTDLQSLVRHHGAMPPGRVIWILRQVCASLREAHSRGFVHRDVKPANIHLGRLGLQHDFVKVLDFGLVKSVTPASHQESLESATGVLAGTPAYMSPEMALGQHVDARADIYAVGCVGYFLLTGAMVFEAETMYQLMAMMLRDEPVPPSTRLGRPLPEGLDRLILACLAKNPEQRPQSAAEVARLLDAIEVEPWGEEQAASWWASNGTRQSAGDVTEVHHDGEVTQILVTSAN